MDKPPQTKASPDFRPLDREPEITEFSQGMMINMSQTQKEHVTDTGSQFANGERITRWTRDHPYTRILFTTKIQPSPNKISVKRGKFLYPVHRDMITHENITNRLNKVHRHIEIEKYCPRMWAMRKKTAEAKQPEEMLTYKRHPQSQDHLAPTAAKRKIKPSIRVSYPIRKGRRFY
jgi:hypothetical protein